LYSRSNLLGDQAGGSDMGVEDAIGMAPIQGDRLVRGGATARRKLSRALDVRGEFAATVRSVAQGTDPLPPPMIGSFFSWLRAATGPTMRPVRNIVKTVAPRTCRRTVAA
jgi:hypothetical protein